MNGTAIAVMDFAKALGPGCPPIAVNQDYSNNPGQVVYIGFNPDPEDNGGWFSASPDTASSRTFKDYIKNGSCPALSIGDVIDLANGCNTSVLELLKNELVNHPNGWVVFLPVVDTPKFNHDDNIDNFVPVRIIEIKDDGNPKYVKWEILTLAEAASALPGGAIREPWRPPSW